MKMLIVPDVHGRDFWVEPCKHIDEFDKVIFLGDYHDPYPYEVNDRISRHRLRDELVPFVIDHADKIVCLKGNHDSSYTDGTTKCRFDKYHWLEIRELLNEIDLRLAYREGRYLFSHSGITERWLNNNDITLTDVLDNNINVDKLDLISTYRGGDADAGSCIWGDLREFAKLKGVDGYYQIFGHTQLEIEIVGTEFACLDCRKAFVLDTESGKLEEF